MATDFQQTVLYELALLLAPIREAAKRDTARRDVLAAIGWVWEGLPQATREQIDSAFITCGAAADALNDLLSHPPDSLDDVLAMLANVRQAFEGIRGLSTISGTQALPGWSAIGTDLIQSLTLGYLQRWVPLAYYGLALLTLVTPPADVPSTGEVRDATGTVVRTPYQPGELHLERVGSLLSDPVATLSDAYFPAHTGLSDETVAQAAADRLLPRVAGLLTWLGAHTAYDAQTHTLSVTLSSFGGEEPPSLTLALSAAQGGLVVTPSGRIDISHLMDSWDLRMQLSGADQFVLSPQGSSTTGASVTGQFSLAKRPPPGAAAPAVRVGSWTGSRLEIGGLELTAEINTDPINLHYGLLAEATSAALVIAAGEGDGFLQALLPADGLRATFSLGLGWSNRKGVYLTGSASYETTLTVHLTLGPVLLEDVHIAIRLAPQAAATGGAGEGGGVQLELSTTAIITIGPVAATIERVGLAADLHSAADGNLGPLNLGLGFKLPDGLGLAVDAAGVVRGGGFLAREVGPPARYLGALALTLTDFAVGAYGVFEYTPGGQLSFVVVLGVRFTPGVALGFGFTLNGIGGMLGVNRRADGDALRARLVSGAAATVLFVDDPLRDAPALLGDMEALFPPADGVTVVGPTAQIEWLGLARFDLGILIELPGPSKVLLLGVGRLTIGGQAGGRPLVELRLDLAGVIDFAQELVAFDAVLVNSRLLQLFRLTGTAAFRLSTGDQPYVLLTIGGFHPAFHPEPPLVPAPARVGLSYDSGGTVRVWLRLETYLAITSNTFQVGAALDAGIEVGSLQARGFFTFDALIQFTPFYFSVGFSAGFHIEWGPISLASVRVDGTLSGPGPLVIDGRFTIEILFFDISWHDTFTLGEASGERAPSVPSLLEVLQGEIGKPANLEALGGGDREVAVTLGGAPPASGTGAQETVVLPQGQVIWRQKRAPFNVLVERFEGVPLPAPQAVVVATDALEDLGMAGEAVQDWFSPGTFITLSTSEALNQVAFERLDAGVCLSFAALSTPSDFKEHTLAFDVYRLPSLDLLHLAWLQAPLAPLALLAASLRRRALARADLRPPSVQLRDELWTVSGPHGERVAGGLRQTDAHQRARVLQRTVAAPDASAAASPGGGGGGGGGGAGTGLTASFAAPPVLVTALPAIDADDPIDLSGL